LEIAEFEDEMSHIQDSASLFEVNVPDFKQIKQCRKELRMLKVKQLTLVVM
jgi:dynein heavy chain